MGAVVVQALIAHLAPASSPASTPLAIDSPALAVQLAAIEQRLQILEQLSPALEQPLSLSSEALPLPERRLTAAEAEGLLPLPQVVEQLGLSGGGSAVTNWIARETIKNAGNVPLGAVYRGGACGAKAFYLEAKKLGGCLIQPVVVDFFIAIKRWSAISLIEEEFYAVVDLILNSGPY